MRFLIRTLSFLLLVTCFLFLVSSKASAEGEFETDYKITYQATQEGKTNVTQNIILKNKTPNYYADKFELKIGSTKIEDVKASDSTGPLETNVKFEENVSIITVKFNNRVIGIDKSLIWTLNYSSNELTTKSGQIWEVSIPKVASSNDIGKYDVAVIVPSSFGENAFTIPSPTNSIISQNQQEFTFEKSQLTKSGIAMSFGAKQIYSFTLNYYLLNSNLTTQFYEIALPPDNNYQRVVYDLIEPKPLDVAVDKDGNFKGRYKLSAKQHLEITASGSVEVFHRPFRKINAKLTDNQKAIYLAPQKYWEVDNASIHNKANELKIPEKIYQFVTDYLSYNHERLNQERIERKGAATIYSNPKDAVCMEFTDLFIALSRAAGIPAREIEGYAYTQNERLRPLSLSTYQGDLLHAWPEYWDEQIGWVQVDPTWGSTSGGLDYFNKLDFNHITFIQRGTSSTTPIPAGAYKKEATAQNKLSSNKSVIISFAEELKETYAKPELSLDFASKVISGIPLRVSATVRNTGNSSIIGANLALDSPNFKNISQNPIELEILPPFSHKNFDFNLHTTGFFNKKNNQLTLSFADESISKNAQIVPIYYLLLTPKFMLTIGISSAIIALGFFLYERFTKQKLKMMRKTQK